MPPSRNVWHGLEQALRRQLVEEGQLPRSVLTEGIEASESTTIELETDAVFCRTFSEPQLGLALNVGTGGGIIVKRCMPDSPSASRRIPPGVFLTEVHGEHLEQLSLKQVQRVLQDAERPVTLRFAQSESSRALAEQSVRLAQQEREAAVRAEEEARVRREEALRPVPLETASTFSRTYSDARIGLCLVEGAGAASGGRNERRTVVKKCLPCSAAWKSGIPPGSTLIAINGASVEFRRFKQVKKLIELAARPVTIDFSTEEPPIFPQSIRQERRLPRSRSRAAVADVPVGRPEAADRGDRQEGLPAMLPAYALRPA
jgi:C-terminal processing protease CtpA/Prc